MDKINIAIDGPAGAGKSTIAKKIAQKLNIIYVDTGAMYRTVAYYVLSHGKSTKEKESVIECLSDIHIDLAYYEDTQRIFLNKEDITHQLRTQQIAAGASDVATIKEVRVKLVEMQKHLAEIYDVVMDGRDIGTQVLPKANLKIFLTASVEERALRRCNELKERNLPCDLSQIRIEIEQRDYNDTTREESPLVRAEDAVLLDTTSMTIDQVVDKIISLL